MGKWVKSTRRTSFIKLTHENTCISLSISYNTVIAVVVKIKKITQKNLVDNKSKMRGLYEANLEYPLKPSPTFCATMLESTRNTLGSSFGIHICRVITNPPPMSASNKRDSCSPACSRFRLQAKKKICVGRIYKM